MKLKNDDIYITYKKLMELIETQKENFNVKLTFSIVKLLRNLVNPYEVIEENKKIIMDKVGTINADNTDYTEDSKQEIVRQLIELGQIEQEVEDIKINLSDLKDASLSLETMNILYPFINEDA
uniref:Uncharacterized protein n=1 Tax=Myoviridae sp. ctjhW4 TaxID=2825162 RepID=A0A8S5PRC3_9CAUD|nr:MAG TPA: Protein of unknown function (DUF1617) [Myoviridae sp. ctjhW4]